MDTSEKVWHISDIIVETCVHLLHGYANVIVDAGIVNIDFVHSVSFCCLLVDENSDG